MLDLQTLCHTNLHSLCLKFFFFSLNRLFAEKFSNLSLNLEGVLSMMLRHPQYSCVAQIKDQLAADGPVCMCSCYIHLHNHLQFAKCILVFWPGLSGYLQCHIYNYTLFFTGSECFGQASPASDVLH